MLNQIRLFISAHSPDWLNVEVNQDFFHYFSAVLTSEQAVRKPLGQTVSRVLFSKRYHTSLPGAPDGEYVVIQFNTSFENKKSAIETVTPMKDEDGKWRVSGYYIK